ncbi:MAG: methyltransferase domain-containing protein [Elusimicrobiota bacterium]
MGKKKIDYGLKFYRDIFKLNSLHFGLWDNIKELTVDNLRLAQEKYIERLLGFIPADVKSVLDVGCGTGSVSAKLSEKKFNVEALTPDEYQATLFRQNCPDITFYPTKFEDLETDRKYDLILSAESWQYLNLDDAFAKCQSLLRPGGYLLIADYFRKTQDTYYRTCHVEKTFLETISKYPFESVRSEDITEMVLPTLKFGTGIYSSYVLPVMEIISGYLKTQFRFAAGLLSFLFSGQLKRINKYIYVHTKEKLDAEKFKERMVYKIFLYKKRV